MQGIHMTHLFSLVLATPSTFSFPSLTLLKLHNHISPQLLHAYSILIPLLLGIDEDTTLQRPDIYHS